MVLDTETTGLLKKDGNYYPHPSKFEVYPRLVELGYIIFDSKGNQLKSFGQVIKPVGFEIKNIENHGISQEMGLNGKNVIDVFSEFEKDLELCGLVVGHNIEFDVHILLSEILRSGDLRLAQILDDKPKVCTVQFSCYVLGLERYPKLEALNQLLFGDKQTTKHRALSDAEVCAKCYFKLETLNQKKERGNCGISAFIVPWILDVGKSPFEAFNSVKEGFVMKPKFSNITQQRICSIYSPSNLSPQLSKLIGEPVYTPIGAMSDVFHIRVSEKMVLYAGIDGVTSRQTHIVLIDKNCEDIKLENEIKLLTSMAVWGAKKGTFYAPLTEKHKTIEFDEGLWLEYLEKIKLWVFDFYNHINTPITKKKRLK